jgi:hypothetical protein
MTRGVLTTMPLRQGVSIAQTLRDHPVGTPVIEWITIQRIEDTKKDES